RGCGRDAVTRGGWRPPSVTECCGRGPDPAPPKTSWETLLSPGRSAWWNGTAGSWRRVDGNKRLSNSLSEQPTHSAPGRWEPVRRMVNKVATVPDRYRSVWMVHHRQGRRAEGGISGREWAVHVQSTLGRPE